jgi:murein L,D-transpeptidase YafK|tara:strand:- start:242 stop:1261 length:1020 start_codon:yes stop_codon:yes gene_type:complete
MSLLNQKIVNGSQTRSIAINFKALLIFSLCLFLFGKSNSVFSLEPSPPADTPSFVATNGPEKENQNKLLPIVWVNVAKGELQVLDGLAEGKRETLFTTKVSIGKNGIGKTKAGDKKTPVGIYRIKKFIPGKELPRRYGAGAFTLNYPNQYDKILDRTGDGIWIHGRPSEKAAAPYLDTKGCITMDNESLEVLANYIRLKETTVIISDNFDYTNYENEKEYLVQRIQQWSDAWVSLDHEAYMAFYHRSFFNGSRNYSDWDTYKGRINAFKSHISIQLSDFEILNYPEKDDLVWVSFQQKYASSNYNWMGRKITLWQKDSRHRWKIVSKAISEKDLYCWTG